MQQKCHGQTAKKPKIGKKPEKSYPQNEKIIIKDIYSININQYFYSKSGFFNQWTLQL